MIIFIELPNQCHNTELKFIIQYEPLADTSYARMVLLPAFSARLVFCLTRPSAVVISRATSIASQTYGSHKTIE